jgi:hypothetical protein
MQCYLNFSLHGGLNIGFNAIFNNISVITLSHKITGISKENLKEGCE